MSSLKNLLHKKTQHELGCDSLRYLPIVIIDEWSGSTCSFEIINKVVHFLTKSINFATICITSLETIAQEMTEQREDIDDLDDRVTATDGKVDSLTGEVNENKVAVAGLREDVDEQGEKLADLEEVVEETVEKVEEIDHKVSFGAWMLGGCLDSLYPYLTLYLATIYVFDNVV